MSDRFRFALCNEVYKDWTLADMCRSLKEIGYTGIEIAPFTLRENPVELTAEERREHRRTIEDSGLEFVGLHWLMVSPKGLHVTTPDEVLRQRSWDFVRGLIDLCADLGENGVLVFGSPYQRTSTGGSTVQEATKRFVDGIASVAAHAEQRGVRVLMEALPVAQSDVLTTLDEAVGYVQALNSPAVRTMFDTHNAIDEVEPHPALVERHIEYISHVHVNELDGRYPGAADYPFRPLLEVLAKNKYQGWVSAEVFDFSPGPEVIARETLRHLRAAAEGI